MDPLTKRQRQILTQMRDTDADLVYENGVGYCGYSPVSGRTIFALLRLCAISDVSDCGGGLERYEINSTGKQLLDGDTSALKIIAKALTQSKG